MHIGGSRVHMPSRPHKQMPARAEMLGLNCKHPKVIYSDHSQQKQKHTELSKVTVWHEVCFAPNAFSLSTHSITLCPAYRHLHSADADDALQTGQGMFGHKIYPHQLKLFWYRMILSEECLRVKCARSRMSKQILCHHPAGRWWQTGLLHPLSCLHGSTNTWHFTLFPWSHKSLPTFTFLDFRSVAGASASYPVWWLTQ